MIHQIKCFRKIVKYSAYTRIITDPAFADMVDFINYSFNSATALSNPILIFSQQIFIFQEYYVLSIQYFWNILLSI